VRCYNVRNVTGRRATVHLQQRGSMLATSTVNMHSCPALVRLCRCSCGRCIRITVLQGLHQVAAAPIQPHSLAFAAGIVITQSVTVFYIRLPCDSLSVLVDNLQGRDSTVRYSWPCPTFGMCGRSSASKPYYVVGLPLLDQPYIARLPA